MYKSVLMTEQPMDVMCDSEVSNHVVCRPLRIPSSHLINTALIATAKAKI